MVKKIQLVFLVCLSQNLSAQWTQLPITGNAGFQEISFVNASIGIVFSGEVMLLTQNAGNSWDTIQYSPNESIVDAQFLNDSTIFFNGYYLPSGTFMKKTYNAGANWSYINNVETGLMYFTSADTGHVFQSNYINRTGNGGNSWVGFNIVQPTVAGEIFFVNPSTGYVAGWYNGIIFKTIDYGVSWQLLSFAGQFLDIFFPSGNTGYVVGWYGDIQKTTDAGASWQPQTSGTTVKLNSVYCCNNTTCYAVGDDGLILKTIDGGNTWLAQYSGVSTPLHSVFCTNDSTCYAAGSNGVVLKTTNGGVGVTEIQKPDATVHVFPNPSNKEINITTDFKNMIYKVELYTLTGKLLHSRNYSSSFVNMEVNAFAAGMYMLRITTENGISAQRVEVVK